jgi:peroxiredoxin
MSAFRDEYPRLEGLNTQVLGISTDSVPALSAWARHLGVSNYPFLSDFWPHGEVIQKYGLLRAEGFSERAIVIIDRQGIIRYFNVHELKTAPSVGEIVKELEKLSR